MHGHLRHVQGSDVLLQPQPYEAYTEHAAVGRVYAYERNLD